MTIARKRVQILKNMLLLLIEKGGFEPPLSNETVDCGNFIAAKCEDCILDIGQEGCLDIRDCYWNKATTTCTKKGIDLDRTL